MQQVSYAEKRRGWIPPSPLVARGVMLHDYMKLFKSLNDSEY